MLEESLDELLDPEDEVPDVSMVPASPETMMMTINRIWIVKPLTLSTSPIEVAPPTSIPTRWKNRISSAILAAELGTARAMNWIAYWSIRTGPYRTGWSDAPIVENAWKSWTTGVTRSAIQSQVLSALWSSSTICCRSTPASAAMIA